MSKNRLRAILAKFAPSRRRQARAFRTARRWSNQELGKVAPWFSGRVLNVSAWEDKDKEGSFYRSYFSNSESYEITNFGTDQGTIQGSENEFYLDLEEILPEEKSNKYDVVFNHTTLEHVYDFKMAFYNICALTSDIAIIVVPWLQPLHSNYGDYWRFSPQAIVRMFKDQGMTTLYLSWNDQARTSVYVFAVASRRPEKWHERFGKGVDPNHADFLQLPDNFAGKNAF